jgi:hypothetical protein
MYCFQLLLSNTTCAATSWHNHNSKWRAQCRRVALGCYATEEEAAKAYNVEAARLGLALNVIPPAGAAGAGAGVGAGVGHTLSIIPAGGAEAAGAAAVAGAGTGAGAGASAGRKRAAPATGASQKTKKVKLAGTSSVGWCRLTPG